MRRRLAAMAKVLIVVLGLLVATPLTDASAAI
jgi:hypothetical protein